MSIFSTTTAPTISTTTIMSQPKFRLTFLFLLLTVVICIFFTTTILSASITTVTRTRTSSRFSSSHHLPDGFVYVAELDPSILKVLRYRTNENFIGRPLIGYTGDVLILTEEAALALSNAQQTFLAHNYSLVIYDAYRPQRTLDYWVSWGQNLSDQLGKGRYYPRVAKEDLFRLEYLTPTSSHSRGSTVDATIIHLDNAPPKEEPEMKMVQLTDGSWIPWLDDGTVDMGTGLDFFDNASHTDTSLIWPEQLYRRNFFRQIMSENGFYGYDLEWWHYTLREEPFPDTWFDFEIA